MKYLILGVFIILLAAFFVFLIWLFVFLIKIGLKENREFVESKHGTLLRKDIATQSAVFFSFRGSVRAFNGLYNNSNMKDILSVKKENNEN